MTDEFKAEPPSSQPGRGAFCPKCHGEMGQLDVVCPHCGYDFPDTASPEMVRSNTEPRERPKRFVYQKWADIVLVLAQVVTALSCIVCMIAAIRPGYFCEASSFFLISLALFVVFGRARDIRP